MTAQPVRAFKCEREDDGSLARSLIGYKELLALSANTAKSWTVPSFTHKVEICASSGVDVYVQTGGTISVAGTTDGTGPDLIPAGHTKAYILSSTDTQLTFQSPSDCTLSIRAYR